MGLRLACSARAPVVTPLFPHPTPPTQSGAGDVLERLTDELQPLSAVSAAVVKTLGGLAAKLRKPLDATAERLVSVGHAQLLRRALAHELRFTCRLDSSFLSGAVEAVNDALLLDIRRHYYKPDEHALPSEANPLLAATAQYCDAVGLSDPLASVYLQVDPALQVRG